MTEEKVYDIDRESIKIDYTFHDVFCDSNCYKKPEIVMARCQILEMFDTEELIEALKKREGVEALDIGSATDLNISDDDGYGSHKSYYNEYRPKPQTILIIPKEEQDE